MRLVHTVAHLAPGMGGPSTSVPALCKALAAAGEQVSLVTGSAEVGDFVRSLEKTVELCFVSLGPYVAANFSFEFWRVLRDVVSNADLVHTHGLWLDPNWASARAARRGHLPLVVSPRGMLAPQALARSRWRKRAAWAMLDGPNLRGAALIHASSAEEARQVRAAGVMAPIAVIANGVDTGALLPAGPTGRSGILFLGRIHPIKGIDLLLKAWQELCRARMDLPELLLAGPGEDRDVSWLRSELARLGDPRVRYLGSVWGEAKLELLRSARAVVLPSRTESYGMVVAEALACGTPVIATTGAPWKTLASARCGWHVEPEVEALAAALDAALAASDEELCAMGKRGRSLVERDHSLATSAARMIAAYSWVLGRGARPETVIDRNEAA